MKRVAKIASLVAGTLLLIAAWPAWQLYGEIRKSASEDPLVWEEDIERHEALSNRAVMKGHGRQYVAADWLKLRAA